MITKCKNCGIEVEVDVDAFNDGDELQTTCPECGTDFDFVVVKDGLKKAEPSRYYYLDDNNEQNGPLPIMALKNVISGSTLVWKEGMPDWEEANNVGELKALVQSVTPPPIPQSTQVTLNTLEIPQPGEVDYQPNKPSTYMTIAVLCTLFCCIPLGVCAIYYSSKVDKAYYEGDYFTAEQYSEKAKTWAFWGMGLGVISYLIYFFSL